VRSVIAPTTTYQYAGCGVVCKARLWDCRVVRSEGHGEDGDLRISMSMPEC